MLDKVVIGTILCFACRPLLLPICNPFLINIFLIIREDVFFLYLMLILDWVRLPKGYIMKEARIRPCRVKYPDVGYIEE